MYRPPVGVEGCPVAAPWARTKRTRCPWTFWGAGPSSFPLRLQPDLPAAVVAPLAARLAIEGSLQLPARRLVRRPGGAQGHQRDAVAAFPLGLKQVVPAVDRLANRGFGLG